MDIVHLFFITFVGSIGVVYIFLGRMRNNRQFLYCGIALAVYPLLISNVAMLSAIGIFLIFAPVLINKFAQRIGRQSE